MVDAMSAAGLIVEMLGHELRDADMVVLEQIGQALAVELHRRGVPDTRHIFRVIASAGEIRKGQRAPEER